MGLADYGAYPGQDDPAQFVSWSGALTTSSQQVQFLVPMMRVLISVIGGSGAHVNFAGTATTGNYLIGPDTTFTYQGRPVTEVHVLGVAAAGTVAIHAN